MRLSNLNNIFLIRYTHAQLVLSYYLIKISWVCGRMRHRRFWFRILLRAAHPPIYRPQPQHQSILQRDRQTEGNRETERQRGRDRERQTDREGETDRQRGRDRQTEREGQTDRQADRAIEPKRQRRKEKERQRT